jgi:hypothetical protein
MKIAFISPNPSENMGSYRIHVKDLCYYFNRIGIVSSINPNDIHDYNIIILQKGIKLDNKIKNTKYPNKKVGIITPSSDDINTLRSSDFIIVGSTEEKESIIKNNKNCFLFPQIENMYQKVPLKIHEKKDIITIGYHGNQNHLNHMSIGLKWALEKLSTTVKIKFTYICKNNKEWIQGKPNIHMEFKKWKINTIIKDIQQFDIGIVPSISEISSENNLNSNLELGIYSTDYKIRFKNKSNIGRSLVLFQCGIPVVADIIPSNMHMLANPDNGYAVASKEGWYYALKELCCETKRNFIAINAYNECKRLYNPLDWARRLESQIKTILFSHS